MNTNPTASASAQHRRVHGTIPRQGASIVLSAALVVCVPSSHASRHAVGRLVPSASFDAAIALYERGEWEPAFQMLQRLADAGDALSAKLVLLMLRYGAPLYGTHFEAMPRQIARWARVVLAARQ
jgi:hypothetical protein